MKQLILSIFLICALATSSQPKPKTGFRQSNLNNLSANTASIGGIINAYTPVTGFLPCQNNITVEDGSAFKAGDTVLIIQMKGAVIDSANTAGFGAVTSYANCGNYEFNYVKSRTGNVIELLNHLTRQYNIPSGKVQLVRVPYYHSANVTSLLSCLPWDGAKGGILVLNARDTITLAASINTDGKGFRGGRSPNSFVTRLLCFENNYTYPLGAITAGAKGECIADYGNGIALGKGAPANAGGGGLGHNSGGGGGGNWGRGGFGGYQLEACGNAPFDNRGLGGGNLAYTNADNKIFMGGGGGSGQVDNRGGSDMNGGNGGAIIVIISNYIKANGFIISSKGTDPPVCSSPPFADCHDGSGGGGGGGAILINTTTYLDPLAINNSGGKGADLTIFNPGGGSGRIGPGGGGGAGIVWFKSAITPANINTVSNGGSSGVILGDNNSAWGATPGQPGTTLFNLNILYDLVLFKKNIDSVNFTTVKTACAGYNFSGMVRLNNGTTITSWQWTFGDGAGAATQNTAHTYATQGSYIVKLVVTDAAGCKDSISKTVMANNLLAITRTPDSTICTNTPVQLNAAGGTTYTWTPAATLSDPKIANPVARPGTTTTYYVSVSLDSTCSGKDSVKITVRQASDFKVDQAPSSCIGSLKQLNASGGNSYRWSPAVDLSNPFISNPLSAAMVTTPYTVVIKDTVCKDSAILSTVLTVYPTPVITAQSTNSITCNTGSSQLLATGGTSYVWSPVTSLSNANIARPIASPPVSTSYTVTGTDANKCTDSATVTVLVQFDTDSKYYMPNSFTPNGDGLNDCYGLKNWGQVTDLHFSIYNRWGQVVFYTRDATKCWDGRYKSELQQSGNFIYIVKAKTPCGIVDLKGYVILIR